MYTMTNGPGGPTRKDDAGGNIGIAGEASLAIGDVVVPDYANASGLALLTAPRGAVNHPENIWIKVASSTAGLRANVTMPFAVVTTAQDTKGKPFNFCLQGDCLVKVTAAVTVAFTDVGVVAASGVVGPVAAGNVLCGQAQATALIDALCPVYWEGAIARLK